MKRLIDILLAVAAMLLLSPLIVTLAALLRIQLGSPVLFRQIRIGKANQPFNLCKFRTMHYATDPHGNPLEDSLRTPRLGQFLRRYSLDELPELWNILRGEMSFVGPRPLLPEYLPYYSAAEASRHEVRPGLTGLAQVSGRSHLSWDEQLQLDIQYVDSASLLLDFRIILQTVFQLVYPKNSETPDGKQRISLIEERRDRLPPEKPTLQQSEK
ncbi:MAG: sugar transferase [Puniceicoccaceae bacterium]